MMSMTEMPGSAIRYLIERNQMSHGVEAMAEKKIQGYESYEIGSAADTLIKAQTMKLKEKKLYKLAITELKKRQKAIATIV